MHRRELLQALSVGLIAPVARRVFADDAIVKSALSELGGGFNSGPAVSSWAAGRLDVFGVGLDNAMWHKFYEGGWSDWESLGGGLTSDPSAVSWGPGRVDFFARGQDNAMWHKFYDRG